MITSPATKITNLGALKIVLGARLFALYLAYTMAFSLLCGIQVNLLVPPRVMTRDKRQNADLSSYCEEKRTTTPETIRIRLNVKLNATLLRIV